MSVQAVVYDIGNVLIAWQPERYYDGRIGEAARRRLLAALRATSVKSLRVPL